MSRELIELIKNNPDLPIYAWVNADIVGDGYGWWAGEFHSASIKTYANVEPFGWGEQTWVFDDDTEEYIDSIIDSAEFADLNDEELDDKIQEELAKLEWKQAIFVWVDTI